MNSVQEEWRPVVGYEGFYEVSDLGRVRSLTRHRASTKGGTYEVAGRVRKPGWSGRYFHVGLSRGTGKPRTITVHRLVCEAFIGPRPENHQINHKNGDRTDNRVANLEYVTPKANSIHAVRNGLTKPSCGEHHHWAELSAREASLIRSNPAGLSMKQLAAAFQVSLSTVYDIQCGRSWKRL